MIAKAGLICAAMLVLAFAASDAVAGDTVMPAMPPGPATAGEGAGLGQPMTASPAVMLAAPAAAAQYGGGEGAPSSGADSQYSPSGTGSQGAGSGVGNGMPVAAPAFGLSSWITYSRPDCCGPIGGDGPIKEELYIRTGPSIPAGSGVFPHLLDTGWDFSAGGRSLFFNPACDAAWTIDLGLTYNYNHSHNTPQVTVISDINSPGTPVPTQVTMRDLQRTFADASLGKEWYLWGAANCGGCAWRAGVDVGGRLGTCKVDFAEIKHRTDTIYGYFGALHTDLEKPCGCCTSFIGLRAEWAETIEDFLDPFTHSNVQDINLLMTFGVRF